MSNDPQTMSEEHAEAILAVITADKRLPQLSAKREIVATAAEAEVIAARVWWRTSLHSPAGLAHLFPGLGKKPSANGVPRQRR